MEPLIYFPSFEPVNDTWLKFALIYFENFRPIIPEQKQHLISDDYRRIMEKTDLINPYYPKYNDGRNATLTAKEEVEKILIEPYERSEFWGQVNILRRWKNPDNWRFKIFREKFSYDWVEFCEANEIGKRTDDGILVSDELAFLFMTYLAKEIAFKESAAIITDDTKFDSFTNYSRSASPLHQRRDKFAKGIINLLVPKNLEQIPYEQLIKFRKNNRKLIKAFNVELDNIQQKIGQGVSERTFIDSYNEVYSDFSKEILLQGIGIASIPFAAYMLINNPSAQTPEYIKEILGALGILLGGYHTLHKAFRDDKEKRYCKKYLTNLQRLA